MTSFHESFLCWMQHNLSVRSENNLLRRELFLLENALIGRQRQEVHALRRPDQFTHQIRGIVVRGQKVAAGTILWGTGVVASTARRWLGTETDKSEKVLATRLRDQDHTCVNSISLAARNIFPAVQLHKAATS
jgi:hypothetical protein